MQRQSKLTGAAFAQALVFGWWSNPAATYEQLAQTATSLGVPITAQGLDCRFTAEAAACLKQILEAAVHQIVVADPVALPLLQRFNGVFLQDSTTITLPDALAEVWRGCGGNVPEGTLAALKVQTQVNMGNGQFSHLDLQAGRAQDKTAPMQTAPLPPGALRIAIWAIYRFRSCGRMANTGCIGSPAIKPAGGFHAGGATLRPGRVFANLCAPDLGPGGALE